MQRRAERLAFFRLGGPKMVSEKAQKKVPRFTGL